MHTDVLVLEHDRPTEDRDVGVGWGVPGPARSGLVSLGVSHRDVSLAALERLVIAPSEVAHVLGQLTATPAVDEAIVLSTCNRVEVYLHAVDRDAALDHASALLRRRYGMDAERFARVFTVRHEADAVAHLLGVTCGLDSVAVGEPQISLQVKRARQTAAACDALGPVLDDLVREAVHVNRKVRTQTPIDETSRSLVETGLRLAVEHVGDLEGRSALVIGAGSPGSVGLVAVRTLTGRGTRVTVASRSADRARTVAARCGAWAAISLDDLGQALEDVDLVVTSTGAADLIITRPQVDDAMRHRPETPLFILDLAVPRDVDPAVADVCGVGLADMDTLGRRLRQQRRPDGVEAARAIVTEALDRYLVRRRELAAIPLIAALRSRATALAHEEVRALDARLAELPDQARAEAAAAVHRIVGRLLHAPTMKAKVLAVRSDGAPYLEALAELFEVDPQGMGGGCGPGAAAPICGATTPAQHTGQHPFSRPVPG